MAVARAPVGGGMTGIKVALIVFVCLTVASLAFAVILFTRQADLDQAAASAQQRAEQASRERNQMEQQVSEIARIITGESLTDPAQIQQSLQKTVQQVVSNPALQQERIAPDSAVVTVLQGLLRAYQRNAEQLATTTRERDELRQQFEALNKTAEQRAAEFAAKTTEFENRLKQAEEQLAAHQQAWNEQVESLKGTSGKTLGAASNELSAARALIQKLEQQVEEKNQRIKELADKLARFQPGMDTVSPQQIADGTIIRSIPTEDIVYISLGQRDRITPGMPFSVYPRNPRGSSVQEKATIEVLQVFDATAEARVKSTTPGDPIIPGDLIANLVYDKNRTYRFVVAGDFDLDFDGAIDQPDGVGGQNVIRMIESWGGQVVNSVDSSVDFVVLGSPPPQPAQLTDSASDEARQRAAEQASMRRDFDAIRTEARALSIPVLTRTQFLHFIGQQVPAQTPEDRLAAQ